MRTSYAFFVLDIARGVLYNEFDLILKGGNVMKKIHGFYELDKIVKNRSAISEIHENGKWLALPYESGKYSGTMLCCGEDSEPEPIELDIKLEGWYRIYLGVINASYNYKLGVTVGDLGKTVVIAPKSRTWCCNENGNRFFYRAANMTGQTITLTKPGPFFGCSSSLSFIEFEEMTEEEIAEYTATEGGAMFYHFDEGFLCESTYEKEADYLGTLNLLEGSHGGILCVETVSDKKVFGKGNNGDSFTDFIDKYKKGMELYEEKYRKTLKPAIVERAHELGFEIYTSNRIMAGDFRLPLSTQMGEGFFLDGNGDKKIKTRDGREIPALSFAYESVRKMVVESVIYAMDGADYDGVSLSFHRGVFVGFEEPVCREVERRYGIDARVLPTTDERLNKVWQSYITEFLRDMRAGLDEKFGKGSKKINAIVLADMEANTSFGYDIEGWLKEGLVANISQGLMSWKEDLTDCLDENGLISLDAYRREIEKRIVLTREYKYIDNSPLLPSAVEMEKLCASYGVDFYATLGWDGGSPDITINLARKYKEAGIKKIFSWNTNRKIVTPSLFNSERYIAANYDDGLTKDFEYPESFRVLKYGDNDISYFDVNWNG